MRDRLKNKIIGTSLEPIARKLHALFTLNKDAKCLSVTENNYDKQTLAVMKKVLQKNFNGIDVGCYKGIILQAMLRFAPQGIHFAFEPLPEKYQSLLKLFEHMENIHFYNDALSDRVGTSSFQHMISNEGYSGFRQRRYDRPQEQIQQMTVNTNFLDNMIPSDIPIHFMTVDVEGAEFQVFQGAIKTIKRNQPVIVFEYGLGAADYYEAKPENMYNLLVEQCGLRLFIIKEWLESSGKNCLSKAMFCEQFSQGRHYYFMAAP